MAASLRPLEELPATYQRLVGALLAAHRNLARAAASRLRYRGLGPTALLAIPETSCTTRSYLVSRDRDVLFFFLRGAVVEEVVLQMTLSFRLRALSRKPPPAGVDDILLLRLPPFFAASVDPARAALLAKALGADVSSIVFLAVGGTLLGAVNTGDYATARVARLEDGAARPVICYQRVVSASPGTVKLSYEPLTFLALINQVAAWAKGGYQAGTLVPLAIPDRGAHLAAWRILSTAARSWRLARQAASPAAPDLLGLAPGLAVSDFLAEVVLRLDPAGALAERDQDDAFRLRLSLRPAGGDTGTAVVSLGPPDFLVSGTLHQRLMEAALQDSVGKRLFRQTHLDDSLKDLFQAQLAAAAPGAAVFRVERRGDRDRDVIVARLDWQGTPAVLAAALLVKLTRQGDADYSVQVLDDVDSMTLLYTSIPGSSVAEPSPWLPRYLLSLVDQLKNWLGAVEGGPSA